MSYSEVLTSRDSVRPTDGQKCFPDLMTEAELIEFLRIPEISNSNNYHNVIENLKRMHDLPRITICNKNLYPLDAVRQWVKDHIIRRN